MPLSNDSYWARARAAFSSVSIRWSLPISQPAPGRDEYQMTGAEWMSRTASTPIDERAALTSERIFSRSFSSLPQQMTLQWA